MQRDEFEQRFSQEAAIQWKDLEEAGEVMSILLNDYSVDFDGSMYSWNTMNIDDLDVLLRKAARGSNANFG